MKKPSAGRIQNIFFTVTVTLIAGALYLLAGSGALPSGCGHAAPDTVAAPTAQLSALPVPSPSPAPAAQEKAAAPSPSPSPTPCPGAREADFLAAVGNGVNVRAYSEKDNRMRLYDGDGSEVYGELIYSAKDGCVTGWTLRMEYPEKPELQHADSVIEAALLDSYWALLPLRNAALRRMLPLLVASADAAQSIPNVAALTWCDGALAAAVSGKRYDAAYGNGTFAAYVSEEGALRTLHCVFLFGEGV